MTVKTFLALRLADEPRDRLARLAERLQAWNLPARWVHPEDYHLTLLFLGRLSAEEAAMAPYAVELVAGAVRPPALRLAGLGATGGRSEPRAVYAALEDQVQACADLHSDLSSAMGMTAHASFLPHITLCRPRTASQRELAAQPLFRDWPHLLEANGQADWGPCQTTHLVLYQSHPERLPRYRVLASWPLSA